MLKWFLLMLGRGGFPWRAPGGQPGRVLLPARVPAPRRRPGHLRGGGPVEPAAAALSA